MGRSVSYPMVRRHACATVRVEAVQNLAPRVIAPETLTDLIGGLQGRGFRVLGPTVRDGAIVYDDLESARRSSRSAGPTSRSAGRYRLERRDDEARFGYAVGPHSWKQFLFPPRVRLWRRARADGGFAVEEEPLDEHAARVHRRPRLRAAGDRDPGPRLPRRPLRRPRLRGAARGRVHRRRQLLRARRRRASASRWAPARRREAGYDLALTEILDGEHRFLVEVGQRARRRGPRASCRRAPAADADLAAPRSASHGAARRRWAARSTPTDIRDLLAAQPRAPALGRGRGALPHLRQLHAWSARPASARASRTSTDLDRASTPSARASGTRASRSTTPTSTAAASAPSAQLALPAVADPQARHLARPVRQLRLRRLRPVHHLVPGRDRRHRGGARDPRERGEQCDAARLTICSRRCRSSTGCRRAEFELHRRLRRATSASREGETLFREGDAADTFYLIRHGSVALETFVPARGAVTIETIEPARWSAGRGSSRPTAGTSTRARSSLVRATRFDGACLRGKCDADPRARLRR